MYSRRNIQLIVFSILKVRNNRNKVIPKSLLKYGKLRLMQTSITNIVFFLLDLNSYWTNLFATGALIKLGKPYK